MNVNLTNTSFLIDWLTVESSENITDEWATCIPIDPQGKLPTPQMSFLKETSEQI